MNKLTNIKLTANSFRQYSRAVSGLFLATGEEALTNTELILIWYIKVALKINKAKYLSKRMRLQLANSMEMKPQTLYNRLSDLKKKNILIKDSHGTTLSPIFMNSKVQITINYNENEDKELQSIIPGRIQEPEEVS